VECSCLSRLASITPLPLPQNRSKLRVVSIRLQNHIQKEDQVLVTYISTQLVTVQHDNQYITTNVGPFFRITVYHDVFTKIGNGATRQSVHKRPTSVHSFVSRYIKMCLRRSLPSGSSSGCLLDNIAAIK
jgi:hypothetical protein